MALTIVKENLQHHYGIFTSLYFITKLVQTCASLAIHTRNTGGKPCITSVYRPIIITLRQEIRNRDKIVKVQATYKSLTRRYSAMQNSLWNAEDIHLGTTLFLYDIYNFTYNYIGCEIQMIQYVKMYRDL